MSRKQTIARRFGRAADTYSQHAGTQRAAAGWLGTRLPPITVRRGLEIGCGTGFLTGHLLDAFPDGDWTITDIAPDMVAACEKTYAGRARFAVQDGEGGPLPGPFDLIASNLAFQWFEDLPGTVARLAGTLAPGGALVFTTLGAGTFREWRALLEGYGLMPGVADYPDAESLTRDLAVPGFELTLDRTVFHEVHAGAAAFLRHLRAIGADVPKDGHRARADAGWRRLLLENNSDISLSYDVFCISLRAL